MTRRRLRPPRRLAALVAAGVATLLVTAPAALQHAAASRLEIEPGVLVTYTFPGPDVEVPELPEPTELSQPASAVPGPETVPPAVFATPAPSTTSDAPAEPEPVPAPDQVEVPVTEPATDVTQEPATPLELAEVPGVQPAGD